MNEALSQIQVINIFHQTTGLQSSDFLRELQIEPLLLCIKMSQLRLFACWHLSLEVSREVQLAEASAVDPEEPGEIMYFI